MNLCYYDHTAFEETPNSVRHVGLIEIQPTLLGQITGRQRFSAFHVSCCASLKRCTSAEVEARSEMGRKQSRLEAVC